MSAPRWLKGILAYHAIPYEEHHHDPVYSASRLAQTEHVSGHRVAKTVILANHGRPLGVVLPSSERLDLARVQGAVGNPDLRLATEEEIAGWFKGCQPGAMPPLCLRTDECLLMDRSLAHVGWMVFPGGTPEDSVTVRFADWYRAIRPGVGRFAAPVNGHANGKAPPTVLVVEDEPATNHLFCLLLEREGYTCHGVEEGRQALSKASEIRPSAMLLDLMLPDMSGFDVYEKMRRTGPLRRTPVIIVTALNDEASRQRGRQLGAEAYLTKPFHPEELLAEMHAVLTDV